MLARSCCKLFVPLSFGSCQIYAVRSSYPPWFASPFSHWLDAFLTYLSEATSLLDGVTFNDLQATTSAKEVVDAHQVHSTIRGFELLLLVPTEYLSRSCRMDLVKRALTADILVCRLPDDAGFTPEWICQSLTIIRVFLQRTFLYVGTSEHPVSAWSSRGMLRLILLHRLKATPITWSTLWNHRHTQQKNM